MGPNIFLRSRRRLTFFYALIMFVFTALLIGAVHQSIKWAISSEQARELTETATDMAYAQSFLLQHKELMVADNSTFKNSSDKLFYYVYDDQKNLLNFSRTSVLIEPFILDTIAEWNTPTGEVEVFSEQDEKNKTVQLMMTSHPVKVRGEEKGVVFVGKDVTSINSGLQKATYALAVLAVAALILAILLGHIMSGRAFVPIKEAYEKQRQFAADASHELRTPLSVVMASADLLDSDPSITSPFLKQVIGDVRDEVKKMTKLVSDLLIVARSDNKALRVKIQMLDVGELIGRTIRLMTPLAEKKRIRLCGEGLKKAELQADEQKIKQLVLILVDNAVKYTPEGGQVTVRLEQPAKGQVRFTVKDTGIGIAPEDQARIFDRFFRVDKVRSREMGGNGLGLAIAHEIIKLHKGKISIQSELGEGTAFIVELKSPKA